MKNLTIRQQANRIRKWYDLATPYQIADGLTWYCDANILANTLSARYGVTTWQAAQVIAVLSPQKKWDANKREALALFNQHFNGVTPALGYFATARTISECHDIMSGVWALPPKRIKTYSFADNIAYPDSKEVTIDRHALRVAYDDLTPTINVVGIRQYREAREAYRIVADSLGLKASQVQAVVWVTYKSKVNR